MSDNVSTQSAAPATPPASTIIATVEATFSGDTTHAGVGVLAEVSGAEGSRTLTLVSPATSGKQDTANTLLGTIDTDTGNIATSAATLAGAVSGTEVQVDVLTMPTVTVQDGGGSVTVDGTFWQATQPVSAASLPLPSGAATEAKQPALGTAGTASADVISVQGVASMTALKVDGSAVTQPVSGTVTANAGTGTMAVSLASVPSHAVTNAGTFAVQATHTAASSATLSNVASSASNVTLLSSNASRRGATFYNDSTQNVYVKLGATASATSFSYLLVPGQTLELPAPIYTGIVDGLWASAQGSMRITEVA